MKIVKIVLFCMALSQAQIVLQAESATLTDVTVATSIAGYTGSGYAYMAGSGSITFQVNVANKGFYQMVIRANTALGNKNQNLYVNGAFASTLVFPANSSWFDYDAGAVVLNAGSNTIEIRKDWGYMYFDKITLTEKPPHDYSQVVATPIDPSADTATLRVYNYLRSQFGSKIISGQTSYWSETIALAGKTPVVRAFDFQHYTQGYAYLWNGTGHSFGWEDDGTTQAAIDWYNSTGRKGIVSFQWHWHSPSGGAVSSNTFYTNMTTFDANLAIQSGTTENTMILRDIDSIASQLKRLQNAKVPVLWRPLHEAGGGWFWWGAKGAATAKALYDIVYNRLINNHGLHNLIWVWSTPEPDWYPGNSKVDIIGFDSYPGAYVYGSQKSVFDQLFTLVQGKKLVAMTENGPIPDIDGCVADDAMWSYFSSWDNLVAEQNSTAHIQQVFAHQKTITLDEVEYSTNPTRLIRETEALQGRGLGLLPGLRFDLLGRKMPAQ